MSTKYRVYKSNTVVVKVKLIYMLPVHPPPFLSLQSSTTSLTYHQPMSRGKKIPAASLWIQNMDFNISGL